MCPKEAVSHQEYHEQWNTQSDDAALCKWNQEESFLDFEKHPLWILKDETKSTFLELNRTLIQYKQIRVFMFRVLLGRTYDGY